MAIWLYGLLQIRVPVNIPLYRRLRGEYVCICIDHMPVCPGAHVPTLGIPIYRMLCYAPYVNKDPMCPYANVSRYPQAHMTVCSCAHVPMSSCAHKFICPYAHVLVCPCGYVATCACAHMPSIETLVCRILPWASFIKKCLLGLVSAGTHIVIWPYGHMPRGSYTHMAISPYALMPTNSVLVYWIMF